jgi:hypothetical protein
MRLYNVTQVYSPDFNIKGYTALDDSSFRTIFKDRYDTKLEEISNEGYAHYDDIYIIDIDYNGPFTPYYNFFDKLRNSILADIREEKLNKLNI